MLPKKAYDELKELYRKHRGEELTDEEASAIANRLVRAYYLVTRPDPDKTHGHIAGKP